MEQGCSFEGKIARLRRNHHRAGAPLGNRHGFDLFLEVEDGAGGTDLDYGKTDRGLKNTEKHELRGDRSQAELAVFAFMEQPFKGAIPQSLGYGLEGCKGPSGQGRCFPGIAQGRIPGIRTDGAAFFKEGRIPDFGFLTEPAEDLPELLGQGSPQVQDAAGMGGEGIHGRRQADWGAGTGREEP